ncbi:hypothetical protein HBI44_170410 [Parastagonospora nodorum]|nr:hypothetical protein HBI44_170410 [Parastagonospora nodorum]
MRSEVGKSSSSAALILVRSERNRACMHLEPHQPGILTLRTAHHCTLYAEHCTLFTTWHFIDVTTFSQAGCGQKNHRFTDRRARIRNKPIQKQYGRNPITTLCCNRGE